MAIGAVIFDFNGVLVDDEAIHFALFREILAREGVAITERDYHERYLGYDDRGCFEAALVDAGKNPSRDHLDQLIGQKARRYFQLAGSGLRFFPGAAETLEAVAARWPIAICSGALRLEIEFALRQLRRLDHVSAIVSAEDTQNCKPHSEGYERALAALRAFALNCHGNSATNRTNLDASDCLVVEDSLVGIVAAKGAGMHAVGVPNTYSAAQLREAGADAVVDELANLTPTWIDNQFRS
jgi:beta-phosphoglucomutase-like phosphatase (HAD superfamily)